MVKVPFNELEIGHDWIDVRHNGELFSGIAYQNYEDVLEEAHFVAGTANGPWTFVHTNGQVLDSSTYKDGHPVGKCEENFSDGSQKAERFYSENGRLLLLREWNEDGILVRTFSRNDRLACEYYDDGTLKREIIYGEQEWANGSFQEWLIERQYDQMGLLEKEIDHASRRH